jgi:regulator of protease activity HflC (stomatin/prohibitin superfamily)
VSFKMPWPLGEAIKFDTGASRQLVIGTYTDEQRVVGKATLWTNDHVEGEVTYLATAPTQIDDPTIRRDIEEALEESESFEGEAVANPGTPGTSRLGGLISMQAVVTYTIGDLAQYASASSAARPERLLEAIGERHLNAIVATRSVDDLLGPGRIEAGEQLLEAVRRDTDRYGLGLDVQGVLFYDVHPPKEGEVADAFLEQVNALQSQKTDVENAQREAIGILSAAAGSRGEALRIEAAILKLNELTRQREAGDASAALDEQVTAQQTLVNKLIDDAGGEAASLLADARQERWRTALQEQAEASRFAFEREAFDKAPEYFKSRYYLDAVAEAFALSNRRVISTVPPREGTTVRLNLEDTGSAADLFTTENN